MGVKHALVITLAVLITGCGTSFVGNKLATDGALPDPGGKYGIPFMLPRPLFQLAISPDETDGTKAKYQLSVRYVPDPTQTYAVRLDPAAMAATNFKFKYRDSMPGVLSSFGGGVKEQVTSTIKSLGQFTASVVTLLTTSALDTATRKPVLARLVDTIRKECMSSGGEDVARDIERFLPVSPGPPVPGATSWHVAERSMRTLYHYKTSEQRECLVRTATTYRDREIVDIVATTKTLLCTLPGQPATEKKTLVCPKTPPFTPKGDNAEPVDPDSPKFRQTIKEALEASDIPRLRGRLQQVDRAIDTPDLDEEQKEILKKRRSILRDAIEIAERPTDGGARIVKFLEFFALMPEDIWRGRHVLYLRSMRGICIAESFQGGSRRCKEAIKTGNVTGVVARIDRDIALTAGDGSRYDRILKLREFLTTVRERDVQGGKAPAATEYVTIGSEYDRLNKSYHAAVDAVAGRNKDAPEPTSMNDMVGRVLPSSHGSLDPSAQRDVQDVSARDLFDVPLTDPSFVRDSQRPGWDPNGMPDFVVVLEPYVTKTLRPQTKEPKR